MGKFYNAKITGYINQNNPYLEAINSINEFFNNINGISSEIIEYEYNNHIYDTVRIDIEDTNIELYFGLAQQNGYNYSIFKILNGDKVCVPDINTGSGSSFPIPFIIVSAYIDEDCILLYIGKPQNSGGGNVEIAYTKSSTNSRLFGYRYTNGMVIDAAVNLVDISELVFEDIGDTARIQHTYANMFPYIAVAGTVDFLAQSYFVNNGIRKFQSDFLRECSTVTLGSTVSLPDGNYIALGAHCLAPLDNEEEEE